MVSARGSTERGEGERGRAPRKERASEGGQERARVLHIEVAALADDVGCMSARWGTISCMTATVAFWRAGGGRWSARVGMPFSAYSMQIRIWRLEAKLLSSGCS